MCWTGLGNPDIIILRYFDHFMVSIFLPPIPPFSCSEVVALVQYTGQNGIGVALEQQSKVRMLQPILIKLARL